MGPRGLARNKIGLGWFVWEEEVPHRPNLFKVTEAEGLVSSKAQPYVFNIAKGGTCSIF